MPSLAEFLRDGRPVEGHRPWPRVLVTPAVWSSAAQQLADGHRGLLGLWAEPTVIHMALLDEFAAEIAVLSLECADGRFPSVGKLHPPALRLERAAHDLFGLEPHEIPDARPWLDHGRWALRHPLGRPVEVAPDGYSYDFRKAEGDDLHQIPVGPVHAGIIEPGHFRFTAHGETVVRLEERLGYVHKGIEGLMHGADVARGAALAARVSGDSTVAYGLAFAQAVEAARKAEAPPRAIWLRALMSELERIANHLGDIGAICNDATFTLMHAHCGILRELTLRASLTAFGHRLMQGRIVPGGVACDLDREGAAAVRALLQELRREFPGLVDLYDNTASLQDRTVSTGILKSDLARQYCVGGYVGRASRRGFDARKWPGYPPYDRLGIDVPVLEAGDVNARIWIRIREVEQSMTLVERILDGLPKSELRTDIEPGPGEGMALVESFRGDVLAWVRLGPSGRIERCHMRDPSWFQWPLLEAAIEGNIVADFPLCNKSFNCSYSGQDL